MTTQSKRWAAAAIVCLVISIFCFHSARDRNGRSGNGNIFWTERNLAIFAPKTSATPTPVPSPTAVAPQNTFWRCDDCPASLNQTLLICMGIALLICSLFFCGKLLRNRSQ
ncbi:MAG: hypothetical protein QM676_15320 [Novosphingobium sp.]